MVVVGRWGGGGWVVVAAVWKVCDGVGNAQVRIGSDE
jgi:hypothetical protein